MCIRDSDCGDNRRSAVGVGAGGDGAELERGVWGHRGVVRRGSGVVVGVGRRRAGAGGLAVTKRSSQIINRK